MHYEPNALLILLKNIVTARSAIHSLAQEEKKREAKDRETSERFSGAHGIVCTAKSPVYSPLSYTRAQTNIYTCRGLEDESNGVYTYIRTTDRRVRFVEIKGRPGLSTLSSPRCRRA